MTAGRLRSFQSNWSQITSDSWILQTISGCQIDFVEEPVQVYKPPKVSFSNDEKTAIHREIQDLLTKEGIRPLRHSESKFVSNLFTTPKKSGGLRPVINLKDLNPYVRYEQTSNLSKISCRKMIYSRQLT